MAITTSKLAIIEELQAIREAKLTALQTGQMVQVPGAFSNQSVSFDALCRREAVLRGRLLASGGAPTRLRTRYTGYSGARDWTD